LKTLEKNLFQLEVGSEENNRNYHRKVSRCRIQIGVERCSWGSRREPMISKGQVQRDKLVRYCNRLRSNLLLQRLDVAHNGERETHRGKQKMTIDGHYKVSERSHNGGKEGGKANDIKRLSQEELDKEFSELKERLNIIMELLQERNEDHRYG
jgi:hypothetical protein